MTSFFKVGLWSTVLFLPLAAGAQTSNRDWWNRLFLENKIAFKKDPSPLLVHAIELRIIHYQDVTDEAEWAPGQKGRIVRFIGEKSR